MEMGGFEEEVLELLFAALNCDPQGLGENQAEHLHKALAVHAMLPIVQGHRIGLGGGYSYKVFHIPDRAKMYHKIFHIFHLALYKPFCFVYNGKELRNSPLTVLYQILRKTQL